MKTTKYTEDVAAQISETTLNQLTRSSQNGAAKLQAMIGASRLMYGLNGTTTFHFKMCRKANVVEIEYTDFDLYDIRFHKFNSRQLKIEKVEEFTGLYAEDLARVFTEYTGLDTHL